MNKLKTEVVHSHLTIGSLGDALKLFDDRMHVAVLADSGAKSHIKIALNEETGVVEISALDFDGKSNTPKGE